MPYDIYMVKTVYNIDLLIDFSNRRGAISFTMYNFGSPRVGNKRFAEVYNEVRKCYISILLTLFLSPCYMLVY